MDPPRPTLGVFGSEESNVLPEGGEGGEPSLAEEADPAADAATATSDSGLQEPSDRSRARASLACYMCQRKKIRCTGTFPCANCQRRNWSCRFDAQADGRRKANNRRTVQDLNEATEQLRRQRQMISGMLAIMKVGDRDTISHLVQRVSQTQNLGEIAEYIRTEVEKDGKLQESFLAVDWAAAGSQL
ncbi:hypothetical protein EDD37DRAFT_184361 [Exophiala viscosa]|uniref:Zn(2)-C6 fungal-type domain-containing protein n=1 Tax=Exophiala viscosa TaxID=2486360 RepID=A0AAN6DKZ0_9EURO|nr:hypothetical protein EDD36DRAFT_106871 [Exophiala viscosa]KAI1620077.1 hypothetical protein EDD37DRAFT_184361 [Exophiala viscosa]